MPPKIIIDPKKGPTFYRVSAKALIFDDQKRLLVFNDDHGEWEMPGGGWEYEESLSECLSRELKEEMAAEVTKSGEVAFVYVTKHPKGYYKLSLAVPVTLAPGPLKPSDDDLVEARFVTRQEFLGLPFQQEEAAITEYADQIWPVEKKPSNL